MKQYLPILWLLLPLTTLAAEVEREFDPASGIETVQVEHPGMSLQLLPLNRDYVAAVFSARGLPPDIVESTRDYCAFGTILRNTGDASLHYDLRQWRYVTPDGRTHRVKTKTEWLQEWQGRDLAFRWVLLHEEQTYQPGDWGQGFTTVALPPGTRFDLHYSWTQGGELHEARLENVHCAPEGVPESDS
ncbi:hypothetical protein [Thiohalobacter thiocyanaticus]|uniref:Uncharacterized protein n=1 Tax=Thiohalobacter thiocyanaticus TaxID=585455 RepID=A0A426QIF2_9GAMM|nr:hypothetical protein [Thiohalobacter thiocyanaticus]RRQ21544.1 hypothetical protein D6C00_06060 [Thiohalobacter thiocyanaticus]